MAAWIYSQDGGGSVTPSDISDLTQAEQVEAIVGWFRTRYEAPQNEMPYADNGDRYDYNYIWGGPYNAHEEISNNFNGLASEYAIQTAVERVLRDGVIEWAPTSNHPDRRAAEAEAQQERQQTRPSTLEDIQQRIESGVTPNFGNPRETSLRAALQQQIADLLVLQSQMVGEMAV